MFLHIEIKNFHIKGQRECLKLLEKSFSTQSWKSYKWEWQCCSR